MTEQLPLPLTVHISFLGEHEIPLDGTVLLVPLAPHTMLDNTGADTGEMCLGTTGSVSISKLLDPDFRYRVTVTCISAKTLNPLTGGARQCRRAFVENIK